jgi:hypothetical protein
MLIRPNTGGVMAKPLIMMTLLKKGPRGARHARVVNGVFMLE